MNVVLTRSSREARDPVELPTSIHWRSGSLFRVGFDRPHAGRRGCFVVDGGQPLSGQMNPVALGPGAEVGVGHEEPQQLENQACDRSSRPGGALLAHEVSVVAQPGPGFDASV